MKFILLFQKIILNLVVIVLLPVSARATGWSSMVNVGYFSDSFKNTTTTTSSLMYYGVALLLDLDKKSAYLLGFHYGMGTQVSNDGITTDTFKNTDMGPFMAAYLNKSRTVGLFAGYNIISKGTFSSGGGTPSEWSGTSLQAGFGCDYETWDGVWVGAKIMMYSMSYNRDVTLGATSANISYSRTWMAPMISLSLR